MCKSVFSGVTDSESHQPYSSHNYRKINKGANYLGQYNCKNKENYTNPADQLGEVKQSHF